MSTITRSCEWISVEDRLPGRGSQSLVFLQNGGIAFAWRYESSWEMEGARGGEVVTHWRPLPEPPKENTADAGEVRHGSDVTASS